MYSREYDCRGYHTAVVLEHIKDTYAEALLDKSRHPQPVMLFHTSPHTPSMSSVHYIVSNDARSASCCRSSLDV